MAILPKGSDLSTPEHPARCLRLAALFAVLALALLAAGCGGSGGETSGAGTTLRGAIQAVDAPVDPDTYYGSLLLPVTRSAYEGLVRYAPDSTELAPELATEWEVSKDGKTYTFTLRDGVKFSDGTPFDAEAARASIQRRIDLEGGPTYMVQEIKSMDTPDEQTLVVNLNKPVEPFLSYLASPWGPVMVSPTAVEENAEGDDYGAKWLGTHTAGTGPYVLTRVDKDSKMVLEANPHYWGEEPHFQTIDLSVIPDISSQKLQLEGGSLDFIPRGLSTRDVASLEDSACCEVHTFPKVQKDLLWVNPESEVFSDPAARDALQTGLDKEELTRAVHVDTAEASQTFYPKDMLPDDAAPDAPEYDPAALAAGLAPHEGETVVIGALESDQKTQQLADLVQTKLQAAGVNAEIQRISDAEEFAMIDKPSLRPDIFAAGVLGPDSVHPDTWAQVFFTAAAPANFLQCSVKEADDAVYQALNSADSDEATDLEISAAEAYRESGCWVAIADVPDIFVTRKGITGFDHQLTGTISYGELTED